MENSLKLENLSIGYRLRHGAVKVVRSGLNASLRSGELTCLLGLNGAGKSTLIRTLCRFQDQISGNVLLFGKSLKDYTPSQVASSVAVVLTDRTSGSGLTVREVVSLGRYPYTGYFGTLTSEDGTIIDESLAAVGMFSFSDDYMSGLSDGERQKVMVAKALAQQSPVIILDEPTSFLDISSRIEIMQLLKNLSVSQNKSILVSTHDVELARRFADVWWLMGKDSFQIGAPEDLIASGVAAALFNRGDVKVF